MLFLARKKFVDYIMVLLLEFVDEGFVTLVALRSKGSYLYECVGSSADGRRNEDGPVAVNCVDYDVDYL